MCLCTHGSNGGGCDLHAGWPHAQLASSYYSSYIVAGLGGGIEDASMLFEIDERALGSLANVCVRRVKQNVRVLIFFSTAQCNRRFPQNVVLNSAGYLFIVTSPPIPSPSAQESVSAAGLETSDCN